MDKQDSRILYLDNIRILLTVTVILHHLLITYGAPGGWYYREFSYSELDLPTLALLVLVTAANQAYFMGFFFFLSGYFSARSLRSKPAASFLGQRLLRLGVPVLLFVYLLSPLLRILFKRIAYQQQVSLAGLAALYQELEFGVELGPMWFVLLLLIFTFLFLPLLKPPRSPLPWGARLTRRGILASALATGLVSFLVRIKLPVGSVFQPLNLQVPHLAQYVWLFGGGALAFHGGWLEDLDRVYSRAWPRLLGGLVLAMPLLFLLSGGLEGDLTPALGGWTWQALAYALWEQLFCASLILSLLQLFRTRANRLTRLTEELAASSYAAYLVHPLILVTAAAWAAPIRLHPLAKIALGALPVLALCFLAAGLLRRLPGLRTLL